VNLIALVESPDHVCCRYRIEPFRDSFALTGHSLDIRALPPRWWDRLRTIRDIDADAVIIQRKLLPGWQLSLLRRRTRRLIYDFDDAVFMRDSYATKGPQSRKRARRFAAMVRSADVIVAGNKWLAERARAAGACGEVRVIPSCVDPEQYPRAKHAAKNAVRLVWVGSSSTLHGLERVRDLLDAVAGHLPGISLKLVSNRFPSFGRLAVEECHWSEATEASDIAAGDIGISWVPEDDWSRGKCGLKVLQYMAAGLPVVANPVGVHANMIRHGETGFLAETPAEWVEAIRCLAGNPELRRRMGTSGRWRVENDFSVAAGGKRWRDLLAHLTNERRVAG
jgi:glycosyltransferase involved in cell wall biosynthesis